MSMSGMEAAERVSPLTVLVRGCLERWLSAPILQRLQLENAAESYERKITTEALCAVMLDAVVGMQPSVHAAALARRDEWKGSLQALYAKLGRIDPAFSGELVRHTAEEATFLLAKLKFQDEWNGRVKILDGTMPDGSEHRLGVLRRLKAAGLPANSLVVYDLASGICERVVADEDAYTNERALADILLASVQAGNIYVADRGFSTSRVMAHLIDCGAYFVIREHRQSLVYEKATPLKSCGRAETGSVAAGTVHLYDRFSGQTWKLRRIVLTLDQPLDGGETQLTLVTNLPARRSAVKIAQLYRQRWTIERHFHLIKQELHGQMPSLGEPRAAIFALCLALAAGNVFMLLKALGRVKSKTAPPSGRSLSGYYVALEISHSYAAIDALTTVRDWNRIVRMSPQAFLIWSQKLAANIPWSRLWTHPRGPSRPPPKARRENRHHYSTYRLKLQAKQENAC